MNKNLETLNKLASVIEYADDKLESIESLKWLDLTFGMKQKTRHKIEILQKAKARLRERWLKVVNQMQKEMQPTETETRLHKLYYDNYPVKDI